MIRPRFTKPDLSPAAIAIILIASLILLFLILDFYPKQSTRDYEAAATHTPELEFSHTELAAYDGLQFSVTHSVVSGYSWFNHSSEVGGIMIRGHIENTSDKELFLTVGYLPGVSTTSGPVGVKLVMSGSDQTYRAIVEIKDTPYAHSHAGIAGYYLKPGEEFGFELISEDPVIETQETFEMELEWIVLDAGSFDARTVKPTFEFSRAGSSRVWGNGEIHWRRPFAVHRSNK